MALDVVYALQYDPAPQADPFRESHPATNDHKAVVGADVVALVGAEVEVSIVAQKNLLLVHAQGPPPCHIELVRLEAQPIPWLLPVSSCQLLQCSPAFVVQSVAILDA
jgi:hypothetical protein